MKKDTPSAPVKPTDVIGGIFTARRDLLHGVKLVVAGSAFSVDEADLLISLYCAKELEWDDLGHDKKGFVSFGELERYLVHNPSLLSRRIKKLASARPPLCEVAEANLALGQHPNAKRVRITKEGIKRIEPVWKRYQQMAATLLDCIPQCDLQTHYHVNAKISERIRQRRDGLNDLFSGTA